MAGKGPQASLRGNVGVGLTRQPVSSMPSFKPLLADPWQAGCQRVTPHLLPLIKHAQTRAARPLVAAAISRGARAGSRVIVASSSARNNFIFWGPHQQIQISVEGETKVKTGDEKK